MNRQENLRDERIVAWRLWIIYGLIGFVFLYYGYRLFELQVLNGADYIARANDNRITEVSIPTERGIIYDRNGYVLARNTASYNVTITPANLPPILYDADAKVLDDGAVQEVYRKLSELIGIPVSRGVINDETVKNFTPCQTDLGIAQVVYIGDTNEPYAPVRIACNIDPSLAMTIKGRAAELPGVDIEVQSVRDYPSGSLTATIIGFLGPIPGELEPYYRSKGFVPNRDKVGYAGIEATQQEILGGQNGLRTIEMDVAGKELRTIGEQKEPVAGSNLRLTIDTRLQSVAQEALVGEIDYWNRRLGSIRSSNGVVIAMNPKTGEVLALVSWPTYENNRMAQLIPAYYYRQLSTDPNKPLFNHAISAEHPPGSVFKMPTAVGALNERVVTPEQILTDPGVIIVQEQSLPGMPISERRYVCWNKTGHGDVNWLHGVEESCDVYFYKIGGGFPGEVERGLNIWRLGEYARALGYGARSGIELPGEAKGLMPDPDWKRTSQGESWTIGDTYIASMGQGFVLSTPLHVLLSATTLANEGKFMKPTLIKDILNSEGQVIQPFEPKMIWDVTRDPVIREYDENNLLTGKSKVIEPWVVQMAKEGMRRVVTTGTAKIPFENSDLNSAGKTGTAEYCDNVAQTKNLCQPGNWPTHSWYFGYAPFDDPEIAVVAFVYNGGEGASVAAPIVRKVMEGYFELKAIDAANPAGR